jgi:hypothetical protein
MYPAPIQLAYAVPFTTEMRTTTIMEEAVKIHVELAVLATTPARAHGNCEMETPLEGMMAFPAIEAPFTSGTTSAAEVAGPSKAPGQVVGRAVANP